MVETLRQARKLPHKSGPKAACRPDIRSRLTPPGSTLSLTKQALRDDGLDDETIAKVLEKKGFQFKNIDDPETPKLGGALLRVVKVCYNADPRAVKKLLEECDTFHDLANALIGKRFVATTRKDKNDYTRLDGKGEFYRVMAPAQAEAEEDEALSDIPF
jgi:hypothetical protein